MLMRLDRKYGRQLLTTGSSQALIYFKIAQVSSRRQGVLRLLQHKRRICQHESSQLTFRRPRLRTRIGVNKASVRKARVF
ncbi:hypothetical protein CEXT_649531 [Caerostris extrusa]|uniref:Ribosomal protein S14 n=1 Tax=Caerostris extrusa TaxID=172846 RepID=A0AAV4VHJ7_CAEEX|nr:hypothetical protein CEXT_649531 [Caerostris extrusa]